MQTETAEIKSSKVKCLLGHAQEGAFLSRMGDGDTAFALATGTWKGTVDLALLTRLGAVAAQVMSRAILRAVTQATGLGEIASVQELGYA